MLASNKFSLAKVATIIGILFSAATAAAFVLDTRYIKREDRLAELAELKEGQQQIVNAIYRLHTDVIILKVQAGVSPLEVGDPLFPAKKPSMP